MTVAVTNVSVVMHESGRNRALMVAWVIAENSRQIGINYAASGQAGLSASGAAIACSRTSRSAPTGDVALRTRRALRRIWRCGHGSFGKQTLQQFRYAERHNMLFVVLREFKNGGLEPISPRFTLDPRAVAKNRITFADVRRLRRDHFPDGERQNDA